MLVAFGELRGKFCMLLVGSCPLLYQWCFNESMGCQFSPARRSVTVGSVQVVQRLSQLGQQDVLAGLYDLHL